MDWQTHSTSTHNTVKLVLFQWTQFNSHYLVPNQISLSFLSCILANPLLPISRKAEEWCSWKFLCVMQHIHLNQPPTSTCCFMLKIIVIVKVQTKLVNAPITDGFYWRIAPKVVHSFRWFFLLWGLHSEDKIGCASFINLLMTHP